MLKLFSNDFKGNEQAARPVPQVVQPADGSIIKPLGCA